MRLIIGVTLIALVGCDSGTIESPSKDDAVVRIVTSSRHTLKTQKAAHDTIMATRPRASQLVVEQVNKTLAKNAIVNTVVRDIESSVVTALTDGVPSIGEKACPYLKGPGPSAQVSCRLLVDSALQDTLVTSGALQDSVEQDIGTQHGATLVPDDLEFVKTWGRVAINSGFEVAAVHGLAYLRQQAVCDQTPTVQESAFALGTTQGQALVEASEGVVLPGVPRTQCNTDIIAQTIVAHATSQSVTFMTANPICAGYDPATLVAQVDLAQVEGNRADGITEGLRQGLEALRVRLVNTWQCITCSCFGASDGQMTAHGFEPLPGGVACFQDTDIAGGGPATAEQLGNLLGAGTATVGADQCGDSNVPTGDPLVVNLDGRGVRLAQQRVAFDLGATGEPVLMPALEHGSALLALDVDGNGNIDSGAELFSNAMACRRGRCLDGITALAQFDTNHDGRIDARDPVFAHLVLWRDLNRDGRSTPDELVSLDAAGIREISLERQLGTGFVATTGGTALVAASFTLADGTTGLVPDVWFSLAFDATPRDPRSSGIVSSRF